jgi:spore maturation protein CgeB
MGEYMIKNFEAMACGCVLFAYDQGEEENRALGFVDMHNVVLYRTRDELREKLAVLRESAQLTEAISLAGQALVEQRYTFRAVGHAIVEAMRAPLRERTPLSWKEKLRVSLGL